MLGKASLTVSYLKDSFKRNRYDLETQPFS